MSPENNHTYTVDEALEQLEVIDAENAVTGIALLHRLPPNPTHGDLRDLVEAEQNRNPSE